MAYQISAIAKGIFESLVEFWQWYERSQQAAISAQIDSRELDWLLERVAGIDKLSLRLQQLEPDASMQLKLDGMWQQRLRDRLPVQYLAGETTWRDLDLYVTPAVLIPRPETEMLIDIVQDYCDRSLVDIAVDRSFSTGGVGAAPPRRGSTPAPRRKTCGDCYNGEWVDLGTGSGAIALGLAKALPKANIHAIDRSAEALAIAKQNAIRHSLENRIKFYQGNWFEPLAMLKGKIAGMVSNPPYIPTAEIEQLQPEVKNCEPQLALDGGSDGLEAIRYLISMAPVYLAIGGYWIVEVMAGQAPTVAKMLARSGSYTQIEIHQDRSGIERFVAAIV